MFENPRRGRQARNFTTNVPKILDLKSSSEQIFSENCRWVPLDNDKNKIICHFCLLFYPQVANFLCKCTCNVKSKKPWIKYQKQGCSLQLEKGWLEGLELMALFLKTGICIFCGLGLFGKERDKYKLSLKNRNFFISLRFRHKGVLPVVLINIVSVVGFWLHSF